MRSFLTKCLEAGIFNDFYAQKDAELEGAVESLFNEYFAEEFNNSETPGRLERVTVQATIQVKFQGDDFLIEELNDELEKHQSPDASVGDQSVTAFDFKTVIRAILKQRAAALMNQREDQEAMNEELQ